MVMNVNEWDEWPWLATTPNGHGGSSPALTNSHELSRLQSTNGPKHPRPRSINGHECPTPRTASEAHHQLQQTATDAHSHNRWTAAKTQHHDLWTARRPHHNEWPRNLISNFNKWQRAPMTTIDKRPIALSTIPKPGTILQPCSLPCRPRIKHTISAHTTVKASCQGSKTPNNTYETTLTCWDEHQCVQPRPRTNATQTLDQSSHHTSASNACRQSDALTTYTMAS